jgi:pimeloyl-ACP methyl ester carboxylesterase
MLATGLEILLFIPLAFLLITYALSMWITRYEPRRKAGAGTHIYWLCKEYFWMVTYLFMSTFISPIDQLFGKKRDSITVEKDGGPLIVILHGYLSVPTHWLVLQSRLHRRGFKNVVRYSYHSIAGSIDEWSTVLAKKVEPYRDNGVVFIGHSMGGIVGIVAASIHGAALAGAIIVDAPVRKPDPESQEGGHGKSFRNPKIYPTVDEAIAHFRLVPQQPCENAFILDHIARTSLKAVEGGFTWKFDPLVFHRVSMEKMSDYLASTRCRIAILRGEHSVVVPPDTAEYMYGLLDRSSPLIEIPDAYHHLILDQPLAFIAATRALLGDWEHSIPRRVR